MRALHLVIAARLVGGACVLVEPARVCVSRIGFPGVADDAEPRLQDWCEDEIGAQGFAKANSPAPSGSAGQLGCLVSNLGADADVRVVDSEVIDPGRDSAR